MMSFTGREKIPTASYGQQKVALDAAVDNHIYCWHDCFGDAGSKCVRNILHHFTVI
jgi:hypothetical protein